MIDDKALKEIEEMKNKVNLFFYNGMSAPHKFNPYEVELDHNHKGDITHRFLTAYKEMIENYSLDEMIENQPLTEFDIFVNPPKEMLQKYNQSMLLDKDQYIEDFIYPF